jgi:hypothetical protein
MALNAAYESLHCFRGKPRVYSLTVGTRIRHHKNLSEARELFRIDGSLFEIARDNCPNFQDNNMTCRPMERKS